jgi:hypothetical protein
VTDPSRQFDTRSEPLPGRLHPAPEDYFDEPVPATYDESLAAMLDDAVVEPGVEFLAVLAGDGPALELGIGTGSRPCRSAGAAWPCTGSTCRRRWCPS